MLSGMAVNIKAVGRTLFDQYRSSQTLTLRGPQTELLPMCSKIAHRPKKISTSYNIQRTLTYISPLSFT
jgi:hypothetical protein